jgi:hypothetical protein
MKMGLDFFSNLEQDVQAETEGKKARGLWK